jgi:hypothetical protein
MKYNYKWVNAGYLKYLKKQIIPLKGDKFLFNDMPIIENGKYKGYIGAAGLILCMVAK